MQHSEGADLGKWLIQSWQWCCELSV